MAIQKLNGTLRRADHRTTTRPTPGDVYVAAARVDHLAHCTDCRERVAALDAAAEASAASMRRRDRQLDLPFSRRATAVAA